MALDSPVVILFSSDGNPLAVQNGVAIPVSTPGLLLLGSDGTNSRYLTVDSSGRTVAVGAGTAGTPAGGVLSIQGVSGGTGIPTTQASVGINNATAPTSSDQIGASDGTNLQALRATDLDTGAGTEYGLNVSLRLSGSGGSVEAGTASNPLRINPTGTTTQPVSATSLPLPTGASTEATLAGVLTTTAFQARVNTLGSKTSANSTPVVIASDQAAIPVTQTASTATRSDVSSSASSVTILALNAARKGATIYNDSTKKLYAKFGTTATTSDFTVLLDPNAYYEVPFGYTGRIDGIWAAANGSARITELT